MLCCVRLLLSFHCIDDPVPILRGTWFKGSTLHEHWEPLEEKEAKKIEASHQSVLRAMVGTELHTKYKNTFEKPGSLIFL